MTKWQIKLFSRIVALHTAEIYPSAAKIKDSGNLNGRECKCRTRIFKALGIKKRLNQHKASETTYELRYNRK